MSSTLYLGLILTALALVSPSKTTPQTQAPPFRLPPDIVPRHYNLSLLTDLDDFLFSGVVEIWIECKTTTDKIKLHSSGLEIKPKDVSLKQLVNNENVAINEIKSNTPYDFLFIEVKKKLKSGSSYLLRIPFSGKLATGLTGYYRTSYNNKATNSTKWLAITQFEPIEARRAFPCFDEPAMKATFAIRLGHKPELTAVSNMPISSSYRKNGWIWDEFEVTLPMSTYLVAFVVSDLEYRESDPEPNNITFRTYVRKDAIDQVEFSHKCGPKFLNYFEEFFNITYPLPKQDMIAVPGFEMGAMENWGLITFRERLLLVDENTTSMDNKLKIAVTVAHELAHQWFGNLVTMKWWTDIWLNEGFATYVSILATQRQFPEWNNYNIEIAHSFHQVFALDALKSSHPVRVPISNPSMLFQVFDDISYKKGSLLLHMINSFLGEDIFRAGINAYLMKFKYSNSEQDDLWASLTEAAAGKQVLPSSSVTVKHIMDKWTLQTGYPVVTVRRDGGKITLTQKRFLAIPSKNEEEVNPCWWVPVTFSTAKQPKFNETRSSQWLSCELSEMSIETGASLEDWIMLNNKGAGIYRVNYDAHNWLLLTKVLYGSHMTEIDELNRMLIVADAMALARVGELDYPVAFHILKYVHRETSLIPWQAVLADLADLKSLLWRTDKYINFQRLVRHLLYNVYKRFEDLTCMPEGLQDALLKELMVSWACAYQVGNCSHSAQQLFKTWMTSGTNPIPTELRSVVYCQGVKLGGVREWSFLWQRYQQSNSATEKFTFLNALACTKKEHLLNRYLELSLDESSGLNRQDAPTVFSVVAQNSQLGYKLALSFLENNIQRVYDFLVPETHALGSYITGLTKRMVFIDEIEKMRKFLKNNEKLFVNSQMSVSQGLEVAESNLSWMNDFYANISSAFDG